MTIQPFHRGIYEYLWSEHKYSVIGVGLKAYQGMAARMGNHPHILQFLKKLGGFAQAEKPEKYNSLLNTYMHIKPLLQREECFHIIKTLLENEQEASCLIYNFALTREERSLYGCRVFFPQERGIYKFWDSQDRPGLWICFGPLQLHLSAAMVVKRLCEHTKSCAEELTEKLYCLRQGIDASDYSAWPVDLVEALENNNMVATPGKKVFLHPRFPLEETLSLENVDEADVFYAAAFTLEHIWDNHETNGLIGELPDYGLFSSNFNQSAMLHLDFKSGLSTDEAYDFLATLFWRQQTIENGCKKRSDDALEPVSVIGMQAADEKINSEECEHGDDEADN